MVRTLAGVVLLVLQLPGFVPSVPARTGAIGRSVQIATPKGLKMWGSPVDAAWCSNCKTYYRPTAGEHTCVNKDMMSNRAKLEEWLGTFTVKEGT